MANDTPGPDAPGPDARPGEREPDRGTETTFHPRPDPPQASGATSPYAGDGRTDGGGPGRVGQARPGASWPPQAAPHGGPTHGAPGSGWAPGTAYAAGYGTGQAPVGRAGATSQYPAGQHPAGQYPGAGPAPQNTHSQYPFPPQAPAGSGGRRRGLGALVAVGLVTALLGGGVGGVVGASLAGGSGGSSGALADPLPETDLSTTPLGPVEAVAERVLPSVVRLLVQGQGRASEGSGMVLSADGLMLTNNHVVETAAVGGSIVVVFQDGRTAPAAVVGLDPSSDLAVIRASGVSGLTPIEFGDSDAVRVGEQVVAFGSPLGLGGTVTTGIISAVDRAVSVGEESGASEATVLSALQTDAAINPGNSGGPLTDLQGRVVGINSVIATTGAEGGSIGVGFSIPANHARRVAEELERTGRAERAQLGVLLSNTDQGSGAPIESIVPGSPAEAAGIRAGDVITRFGDQLISGRLDLLAAVGSSAPGTVVELTLADRTVQVTLGVAPR